jgi:hypothetical protein
MSMRFSLASKALCLSLCILLITGCAADTLAPAPPTAVRPVPNNPAPSPTAVPPSPVPTLTSTTALDTPTIAGEPTTEFTILYTNDSRGYVDPCG